MPSREARMRESIETYAAVWNEHDAEKRAPLIARCCAEDFRMVTGGSVTTGRGELNTRVTAFRARFPDARVQITSVIEVHPSGTFRFTGVVNSAAAPPADALDTGECDEDGRLRLLLTFPGKEPR